MQHDILHTNHNHEAFDLNQIFIGREPQLDLFEIYLHRWKEHIFAAKPDASFITSAPSPDNKIQGLVVLLHGRGGYGKSTLLRRYRNMILKGSQHPRASKVTVSDVVDWEFALEGKRAIFHPQPDQEVDAIEYYKILCGQLAQKLGREPKDFKEYQSAVRDTEKALKEAAGILDTMQKDSDRYGWLRGLAVEAITSALRTYVPGSGIVLDNPSVKKSMDEGAKLTQEQLGHLYTHLHEKFGGHLADYLDPGLRLGLAFGRDLSILARSYPLLMFFDTYEEIDEGDAFLRVIMGAAGLRVGWVIAGRDNLWAGSEQRTRSIAVEYGYKEFVSSDLGLSINFNADDVGAFTLSDILSYFDLLSEKIPYEPPLSKLTKEEGTRVLQATQGIPLAVKIAAGLYVEKANLDAVLQEEDGQREIIDQMVRRYLLHTRADQDERGKLYGLALLRRANQPAVVAAALGLSLEQARTSFASTLSQLHRRYSFIFSEKEQPALHQEVRLFLRLWLLEHCEQPEIVTINQTLRDAHEAALKQLEERRHYGTLKERFTDEKWIAIYLDLTEQQFWLDPVEGVRYILLFTIAASVYNSDAKASVIDMGNFFSEKVKPPYLYWLEWVGQGLIHPVESDARMTATFARLFQLGKRLEAIKSPSARFSPFFTKEPSWHETIKSLEELVKLTKQQHLAFPPPLSRYQQELEAALCWRLGAAYRSKDPYRALEWCERAMVVLETEVELTKMIVSLYRGIGEKLVREGKFAESLFFLNRTIELEPDDPESYIARGRAHLEQKEYELAVIDYTSTLKLDPHNFGALLLKERMVKLFSGIGEKLVREGKFAESLFFLNRIIELKSNDAHYITSWANACVARGRAHLEQKEYEQALANYTSALQLDPNNFDARWLKERMVSVFSDVGEKLVQEGKIAEGFSFLNRAIELKPDHAHAYITRGKAHLEQKEYEQALADYASALQLDPDNAFAYINRGIVYDEHQKYEQAIENFTRALELLVSNADTLALMAPLYASRAHLFLMLKEYEKSIEDINRAIELDPEPDNYMVRGQIYLAGLHDSVRAKADYSHSYELDPTDINAAWMAEWSGMGRQRVDVEVVARLELLATSNTRPYIAHVCRGVALGLRGKVKDGLARLEQAISLDAKEYDAYFWKGILCAYYYQGRFQKAKEAIEKALEKGMPPALLTPLYWLEKEKPGFFEECAKPFLERFRV